MYERLKRLYKAERIGEEELTNAVERGWITSEQKTEIVEE